MNIYTTLKAADCVTITADLVKGMPRDPDSPILVFCESKSSLSYETAIAKATGGTFNVDVTSFSRYLSKRVKVDKYLSKAQGALLIRKIMGELSDCLVRIKPNAFNVPRDVYELILQLKSAMVTPEDLYRVIKEEGGALKTKLGDVATIYGAYEKFLKESSLTDEGGFLSLMPAAVKEDEGLKGARVIISGIQSFTRQTLEIVKALSRAASVDFVFASGPYECFTNESVNKISELFKRARVVRLEGRLPWEITAISRGMFNPIAFTGQPKNSDLIEVYSCPDLKTECEQVAARIRRMVVEDGLRYRDFTVLCPSVDTYGPILAQCLDNCEVRYFINKTEGLDKHGVNGLIGGLIDIKRLNLLPESLIETVKCGYFVGDEEASTFEKYVKEKALSRRTIKLPFEDMIAESVRGKIMDVYNKLPKKAAVCEFVDVMLSILEGLGFDERVEGISQRLSAMGDGFLAEFNDGAKKGLYTMLEDVRSVLGPTVVDLTELKNILMGAASAVEIASIPQYFDNVNICDYSDGRMNDSAVVFGVGLTSDVPKYRQDVALLNDRDLIKMDGYRLIIEPKLEIVNLRERENIASALMSFNKKLILSYPMTDLGGKECAKSRIIDYFTAIFGKSPLALSEEDVFGYPSKKAALLEVAKKGEAFRERLTDRLDGAAAFMDCLDGEERKEALMTLTGGEVSEDLFNGALAFTGSLSASIIEGYFSCPYKLFAARTLNLLDPERGEAQVNQIGTFLHGILERFVLSYKDDPSLDVEKTAGKIFDEELKAPLYARYLNKPSYVHIFGLIKEEAIRACKNIADEIESSSFKPYGVEVAFNEWDGQFKPLVINCKGDRLKFRGKIDRVDMCGDYFTVIDYKSGTVDTTAADEEFYTGRKIQLYLYSNVFKREGLKPAGAYYYKLSDDFSSEEAQTRFNGRTLKDKDVICALDNNFEAEGKSKLYGVSLSKDGIKDTKSVMTADGFAAYQKYSEEIARSGAEEIRRGLAVAAPYEKACEYCKYGGLCGYDVETGDRTRRVDGVTKDVILDAVKEGDDGKL